MTDETDFNNLTYYSKDQNISSINVIGFRGAIHIYNDLFIFLLWSWLLET